jgi:hypothetical protein
VCDSGDTKGSPRLGYLRGEFSQSALIRVNQR